MRVTSAKILLFSTILAFAMSACSQQASEDTAADASEETSAATRATPPRATEMPRTASVEGASVFFISPTNGETLTNPITVEFGLDGMEVVKAGDDAAHSGHHHLIIDAGLPDFGQPIPASEHYVHFGDGSTSTELNLEPGSHTLQLLLGDYLHIPHDPPLISDPITVVVE